MVIVSSPEDNRLATLSNRAAMEMDLSSDLWLAGKAQMMVSIACCVTSPSLLVHALGNKQQLHPLKFCLSCLQSHYLWKKVPEQQ